MSTDFSKHFLLQYAWRSLSNLNDESIAAIRNSPGSVRQAVQAGKLRAGKAEEAACAASAAAAAELEEERRRGGEQARRAADLAGCRMAERDLWAAARAAYVARLLHEWTFAARQVRSLPACFWVSGI